MPAKWQRWMPMEIDALKASPSVQAMHPTARAGYVWLLLDAWQSDDCTIPSDPLDLADKSGLGDELWAVYGTRILRKFERVDGSDRLRNLPQYERWQAAKVVYGKKVDAANRTNELRSPSLFTTVTDTEPLRSPSNLGNLPFETPLITETKTGTKTEKQEQQQKPSRAKRTKAEKVEKPPDSRYTACKEIIFAYYKSKNDGKEPPWNGREGKALGMILGADPKMDAAEMRRLLQNRYRSGVVHGDRPGMWLGNIHSYSNGPIDRYGKPLKRNGVKSADLSKQGMGALVGVSAESIARGEYQGGAYAHGGVQASEDERAGLEISFGDIHEPPEEPRPQSVPSSDGDFIGKPKGTRGDSPPLTW